MSGPSGLWPGEVVSYDGDKRTARVKIPGVTDGSQVLPEAVFNNPLGDNAETTEIRIKPGDPVWLMFECGDPRYPIVIGYRTPREGNPTGWRRWAHENIEITADNKLIFNASDVVWNISGSETRKVGGASSLEAGTSTVKAASHGITANTSVVGSLSAAGGATGSGVKLSGKVEMTGGSVTHDGVRIDKEHTHTERGDGNEVSTPH
ncbi:DUF6484 domain-containing protein [Comamonas sp. HJ-2]